jgi:transcription antitermination factor NusA-like protein
MTVIDMQTMRYINILDRASHVKTSKCFLYNNSIIFAVPRELMGKAIGPDAINIRNIQEELGKRIRVIAEPSGIGDIQKFTEDIILPLKFKALTIENGICTINAGSQSKAALIGRNRRRLDELAQILKDIFSVELKII